MRIRAIRSRRGTGRGVGALTVVTVILAVTPPAHGVENIRQVVWNETATINWAPGTSTTSVVFDADLTPLEAAYEVTSFSVAMLHPVGSPEILARFVCGPLPAGLPGRTPARFAVEMSMTCDPYTGIVDIYVGSATIRYVHPLSGELSSALNVERLRMSTSSRQTFGLAILDMNGAVHPMALPNDTFACTAAPDHGSIGVYFDPQGNSCQGTIPGGTTGKVYILAKPAGGTAGGIAGAVFRFTGAPEDWEVYAVPNPDIVAIGDPFGDGVVAGFICQPPVGGVVLLYTVIVIAHETINDVRFEIGERVPTIGLPCPTLNACDEPVFTSFCVDGLSCYVNSTGPTLCASGVAVNQATWSHVKALYR